jgi:hypothetical protein
MTLIRFSAALSFKRRNRLPSRGIRGIDMAQTLCDFLA